MATNEKKDINRCYKDITNRIVKKLVEGRIPWHERWCSPIHGKCNYVTRRPYGGVNLLILEDEGEYMTFNQCKNAGGNIRKGEHSHTIYQHYPVFKSKEDREEYNRLKEAGLDTSHIQQIWLLGYVNVFHLSQTEGLKSKNVTCEHESARKPVDIADYVIKQYLDANGLKVDEKPCDKCSLDSERRTLTIPSRRQFHTEEQWYNTLLREIARTALERADDNDEQDEKTHKKSVVQQELEAEIAACMVMSGVGLTIQESEKDTLAECSRWIDEFNRDFRLVVRASNGAAKAAERILQPII